MNEWKCRLLEVDGMESLGDEFRKTGQEGWELVSLAPEAEECVSAFGPQHVAGKQKYLATFRRRLQA